MKWGLPLLVFVGVLAGWALAVQRFSIPEFIVPGPQAVWLAAMTHSAELCQATAATISAALVGFGLSLVLGIGIACLFAQSSLLARSFFPYVIFLQTVPLVAIAPLIVLWSGPGFRSVVIVTTLVSIFPVITSALAGLTTIDRELLDLFTVYDASRWRTFRSLRLPSAVPHLVAGAQAAGGLAVVGAIAGEVFAGAGANNHGLGYLITLTAGQLKTAYLFAAVLASTAVGLAIFTTLALLGALLRQRWRR